MIVDLVKRIWKHRRTGPATTGDEFQILATNGATIKFIQKQNEYDLSDSAVWTNCIPDGALVLGISGIVTQQVVSGGDRTTLTLADGATTVCSKTLTSQALAAGSTLTMADTSYTTPKQFSAADSLTFAVSGGSSGSLTSGKVRVTLSYIVLGAPTA